MKHAQRHGATGWRRTTGSKAIIACYINLALAGFHKKYFKIKYL